MSWSQKKKKKKKKKNIYIYIYIYSYIPIYIKISGCMTDFSATLTSVFPSSLSTSVTSPFMAVVVILSGTSMLYQTHNCSRDCATTTSLPGTHWTNGLVPVNKEIREFLSFEVIYIKKDVLFFRKFFFFRMFFYMTLKDNNTEISFM